MIRFVLIAGLTLCLCLITYQNSVLHGQQSLIHEMMDSGCSSLNAPPVSPR
jgi:hypothetical protein